MDGNFKLVIIALFIITFTSCKNSESKINDNKIKIIKSNLPILIDSLEYFDWTRLPISKKFDQIKKKPLRVELIDSIICEKNIIPICSFKVNSYFNNNSGLTLQNFKLSKSVISNDNFRNISLVKKSSNDIYCLTVIFSNLLISESERYACIVVTKKLGISMKKDIYFFERKNNVWNYIRRDNLSLG